MRIVSNGAAGDPQTVFYHRCTIDLARRAIDIGDVRCRNLEEVLGGFGRSFQYLAARDVADAFATENPMVVNTGLLTGSNVMTGLRTYFSAYSPLKVSNKGLPAAMWSAGSGKFGSKLKWTGLDELILENKADRPVIIVIRESDSGPRVELRPADHLLGKYCHEKILTLYAEFPNAHFAAIGPGGRALRGVLLRRHRAQHREPAAHRETTSAGGPAAAAWAPCSARRTSSASWRRPRTDVPS